MWSTWNHWTSNVESMVFPSISIYQLRLGQILSIHKWGLLVMGRNYREWQVGLKGYILSATSFFIIYLRCDAILHQMKLINILINIDQYTACPRSDQEEMRIGTCRSGEREVAVAEAGGWSWKKDWWRTAWCTGKSDTWIFTFFRAGFGATMAYSS